MDIGIEWNERKNKLPNNKTIFNKQSAMHEISSTKFNLTESENELRSSCGYKVYNKFIIHLLFRYVLCIENWNIDELKVEGAIC